MIIFIGHFFLKRATIFFSAIFFSINSWALCVTTSVANLRGGPGPKHKITWTVPMYTPLVEIRKTAGWYEVEDMDGEIHWVYSANVTRSMVCVSVKVPTAKLRAGPGQQSELADIRQVDRYTPFMRLDVSGEWSQVKASWGETYWIHSDNLWRPVRVSKVEF